jgi:hypothetical protein
MRNRWLLYIVLYSILGDCRAYADSSSSPKIRQLNVGLDLAQFNYYLDTHKTGFNAGGFAQYKPYYFLGLNAALVYNNVHTTRSNGYFNLKSYNSRGICLKLGFDASVRLSRRKRDTRALIGFQSDLVAYKESGSFVIENYWGNHINTFETRTRLVRVTEINFGFQFLFGRCILRPQVYSIFGMDDESASRNESVMRNYSSPFIPGLGFRRGGLNLLLVYTLKGK